MNKWLSKLLTLVLLLSVVIGGGSCRITMYDYLFQIIYDGNGHDSYGYSSYIDSIMSNTNTTTMTVRGQDDFSKAGYKFLGWSTDQLATTAQFVEGDTIILYSINNSITLYAVWLQIEQ
jgi:uncharacterized repeat protein (TIGR02543 family)